MLRCADGSYYVGSTTGDDLSSRVDQHNAGSHKGYTFSRRPVVLVWSEYFERITDGIAVERQLKGWSRAKKEALLRSDWAKLSELNYPGAVEVWQSRLNHPSVEARKSAHLRMTLCLWLPYFSVAVSACENSSSVRSSRSGVTET